MSLAKSVVFDVYVDGGLVNNAIVESIEYNANGINTCEFSIVLRNLNGFNPKSYLGKTVAIYAKGKRIVKNGQGFLGKSWSEFLQWLIGAEEQSYNKLMFLGIVESVNVDWGTNFFSQVPDVTVRYGCSGIEKVLREKGPERYKFYDIFKNQTVWADGVPFFADNFIQLMVNDCAFTLDGFGLKWTKLRAYVFVNNSLFQNPIMQGVTFIIRVSSAVLYLMNDMLFVADGPLTYMDYIENLCGNLFTYSFRYDSGNIVYIDIVSNVSGDNNDTTSFLNLFSTRLNLNYNDKYNKVVIRYPCYITLDGVFEIYATPKNEQGYEYYVYDDESCSNELDFASVWDTFYKDKGELYDPSVEICLRRPLPDRVDEQLKSSVGHNLGFCKEYVLFPIVDVLINGRPTKINLEEYEIIRLNSFLRYDPVSDMPIGWVSKRPFKDMEIQMEGNKVLIDCDIPHQIAPSNMFFKYSTIPVPVFPIENGMLMYVNAYAVSKYSKEYAYYSDNNGTRTMFLDADFVPIAPVILAQYFYQLLNSSDIGSGNLSGTLIDMLIDYVDLFGKRLNKIYATYVQNNVIGQSIIDCNVVVTGVRISREGTKYNFDVQFSRLMTNLADLLEILRPKYGIPQIENQSYRVVGNYNETFYGKIKEIKYNHYVVEPEWVDELPGDIYVARIDELKFGYWYNMPPSDNIIFEAVSKDGQFLVSERKMKVIKQGGEVVEKYNKVVPDEKLFHIIGFKVSSGNIKTIAVFDGNDTRYLIYLDENIYGRSWAVVPDDEENIYG